MHLIRMTKTNHITIPAELRRALNIEGGDIVQLEQRPDGTVLILNPSMQAVHKIQRGLEGLAEHKKIKSEADVWTLVQDVRYGSV